MPRYDYSCSSCGWTGEISHSIADCDTEYLCPVAIPRPSGTQNCGTELERLVSDSTASMTDRQFQMHGIYSDGRKVAGHFGAPRKGKTSPGF